MHNYSVIKIVVNSFSVVWLNVAALDVWFWHTGFKNVIASGLCCWFTFFNSCWYEHSQHFLNFFISYTHLWFSIFDCVWVCCNLITHLSSFPLCRHHFVLVISPQITCLSGLQLPANYKNFCHGISCYLSFLNIIIPKLTMPPAGYLCVHMEKDESLGTTLILTWVPNSRIQRQDEEALRYITPESSPVRRNARRRGRR